MFSLPATVGILNDAGDDLSRKRDVSHQSPYAFYRAGIASSIMMPEPAAKHADAEIIRHHKAGNEVPGHFSTFLENFGSDPSVLYVPLIKRPAPSLQDLHHHPVDNKCPISVSSGGKRRSSGGSLDLSQRSSLHSIQSSMDAPSTRSSFLSAHSRLTSVAHQPSISPFRPNPLSDSSDPGQHSRTLSVVTIHSALVSSLSTESAMYKTALHPFQGLSPDELDVKVGDKLTLLQTFDDGWCVCVAEHPPGPTYNSEDVMIGLVPLWIFDHVPKGQGHSPHMGEVRTTSWAVTADNKLPEDRTDVVSWSNL